MNNLTCLQFTEHFHRNSFLNSQVLTSFACTDFVFFTAYSSDYESVKQRFLCINVFEH